MRISSVVVESGQELRQPLGADCLEEVLDVAIERIFLLWGKGGGDKANVLRERKETGSTKKNTLRLEVKKRAALTARAAP